MIIFLETVNELNAIRKIKFLPFYDFFNIIFLLFSLIYRRIKKNTTQNPESLLTMSTNSRIMISTPTAIYTVGEKTVREEKLQRRARRAHTYAAANYSCVNVCAYYYAVIVTDFLMREKILKLLFFIRRLAHWSYDSVSYLRLCACVGWKWTITVKRKNQPRRKLSIFLSFTFCLCCFNISKNIRESIQHCLKYRQLLRCVKFGTKWIIAFKCVGARI